MTPDDDVAKDNQTEEVNTESKEHSSPKVKKADLEVKSTTTEPPAPNNGGSSEEDQEDIVVEKEQSTEASEETEVQKKNFN